MAGPNGILAMGNIDLHNRPVVENGDGYSTVRSISFSDEPGIEIVIPTVSQDGRLMSDDEAIDYYYNTGQFLGKFDSVDAANAFAERLHEQQEQEYSRPGIESGVADQILKGKK